MQDNNQATPKKSAISLPRSDSSRELVRKASTTPEMVGWGSAGFGAKKTDVSKSLKNCGTFGIQISYYEV